MNNNFDFMEEIFKLVDGNPSEVEQTLDNMFQKAILSSLEDKYYKDYLAQQKLLFKVYRNSEGKHKVVRK